MGSTFEKLIEQVSDYELLNNIVPGALYVVMTERLTSFRPTSGNVWPDIVIYYFAGMVIGRLGSLCLEPIIKRITKTTGEPHADYVMAEQYDSQVRKLSAINNMYRTYASASLCLALTVGFDQVSKLIPSIGLSSHVVAIAACILLMILFACSYKKQTELVASRVRAICTSRESNTEGKVLMPGKKL